MKWESSCRTLAGSIAFNCTCDIMYKGGKGKRLHTLPSHPAFAEPEAFSQGTVATKQTVCFISSCDVTARLTVNRSLLSPIASKHQHYHH